MDIDEIVQTSIDEYEASKTEASDDIRDADAEIEQYEASIKEAKSTLETGSKIQMDLSRALGKANDAVTVAQDSHSNATLTSDRADQSTAIAMEAVVSLGGGV